VSDERRDPDAVEQALARLSAGQQALAERLERDQALRRVVDEMSERAGAAQARVLEELDRSRRRATRLVVAGMVLVAGTVAGAAVWLAGRPGALGPAGDGLAEAVETRLAPLARDVSALRDESERLVARTDSLATGADAWRQTVLARLDALEAVPAPGTTPDEAGPAERAALAAELDAARAALSAERERADALDTRIGRAEQELAAVTEDRNVQLGVATRLRSEVDALQARLDETLALVESARARREEREQARARPAIEVSGGEGQGGDEGDETESLRRLNEALVKSGVDDLKILEYGTMADGRATDLLLFRGGPFAEPATLAAQSARLLVEERGSILRLEGVRDPRDGPRAEALPRLDVDLPAIDLAAWESAGLASPTGLAPLPDVEQALAALLEPTTFGLDDLGGWNGEALLDVALRERDDYGATRRVLRADRAVVDAAGAALVLEDGTVEAHGEIRPFFRGTFRLELPGADLEAWREAVGLR